MTRTGSLALLVAAAALGAGPAVHSQDYEGTENSGSARFSPQADGSIRDTATGLVWAARDNGGDIDWAGAQDYCRTLGSGWSLARSDELITLYRTASNDTQDCLGLVTCYVTPLVRLTGLAAWSSESHEADEAWYVYFADGQKYHFPATDTPGKRALCVQR